MNRKIRKVLRWTRWILLTIVLLPVVSMVLIKLSGSMKMRKSDDQILGALHSYPIEKKIDTITFGRSHLVYLLTSKEGKKKSKAIVFVHGSPGSLDGYMQYMHNDSLLSEADLIAYDRPGFGHSDFGKSLPSLRGQANALYELMKQLDYEQYWLVGHSYGGPIIMQAVIDRPQRIAGICIVAGSVVYAMEPVAAWRKWLDLPFIRILMPTALRVSNEELMSLRRDLRMIDDDWNEVKMPVSLIHGTKDKLVPYGNLPLAKEKLMNSDTVRTLIFEDENHFILWTQTEQIVKELLKLINL
ncbi:MAG TPA: alpha/beta hydrolase [Saprospiraceae bacterium]|nr:alpha/beta hydrolase [Saprospiraceae bacterium]